MPCSTCGMNGHNRRSCRGAENERDWPPRQSKLRVQCECGGSYKVGSYPLLAMAYKLHHEESEVCERYFNLSAGYPQPLGPCRPLRVMGAGEPPRAS